MLQAVKEPTFNDDSEVEFESSVSASKRTKVRRVTRLLSVEITPDDREDLLHKRAEMERALRLKTAELKERVKRAELEVKKFRERQFGELKRRVELEKKELAILRSELEVGRREMAVLTTETVDEQGVTDVRRVDTGELIRGFGWSTGPDGCHSWDPGAGREDDFPGRPTTR